MELNPFPYGGPQTAVGGEPVNPGQPGGPVEESIVGRDAIYRMVFLSMQVEGLQAVTVGRTQISQHDGPVYAQATAVKQLPGWTVNFQKSMFSGVVRVGEGQVVTVADLALTVREQEVNLLMEQCRQEILAEVGLLAACLDERVGMDILAENLYVLEEGGSPFAVVDRLTQRRSFVPSNDIDVRTRSTLDGLSQLTDEHRHSYGFGSRWFQKAVALGPTPDAVVMLWASAEGLAQNYCARVLGKNWDGVKAIEAAIDHLRFDTRDFPIPIGRVFGVRSEIVHKGVEDPTYLDYAYYELEIVVRLLLRQAAGLEGEAWPVNPRLSNKITNFWQWIGVKGSLSEPKWTMTHRGNIESESKHCPD